VRTVERYVDFRNGIQLRESKLVLFDSCKRPNLEEHRTVLPHLSDRFELLNAPGPMKMAASNRLTTLRPTIRPRSILASSRARSRVNAAAFYRGMKSDVRRYEERAKLARLAQVRCKI